MREQGDVAVGRGRPLDHPVRARADLLRGLAAGHAVLPQQPARPLLPDVDGAAALIGAVVPFQQVVGQLDLVAIAGELAGIQGADQRAGQHQGEFPAGQVAAERPCALPALLGQRQIGAAGVLAGQAPLGLAVTEQPDLVLGALPSRA